MQNSFIKYSFDAPPPMIEFYLECAWDTLTALYPDRLLLTCDCFAIGLYNEELEEVEIDFILGEVNGIPYLLAYQTGNLIKINLFQQTINLPQNFN